MDNFRPPALSPPYTHTHTLDLLAAFINGAPVFSPNSPATYVPCSLEPQQGARMAAAIHSGPSGPGP